MYVNALIVYHLALASTWKSHVHVHTQGSAHTGPRWSAPTTTQPFLPPLKQFLPPLSGPKTLKRHSRCIFYCILARSLALCNPPLRQFWTEPCVLNFVCVYSLGIIMVTVYCTM